MDCDEFSPLAAELALGVLTGRDRADAIAHLEHCGGCRETVRQLAMTGEELVQLLPAVEPPPGFETRVMDRIGVPVPSGFSGRVFPGRPRPGRPRRGPALWGRPRRVLAVAAVALAVVAAGLGGWGLRAATAPVPARAPLSAAAMLSAGRAHGSQARVGHVYFYAGGSPWLYMSVDIGSGNTVVTCQLRGPDGRYTTLGTFRLNDGYGYWGSPVAPTRGPVTGARLVTPAGTVLATARF
jgi:hypothetical protein